jgi:hypothetical protein
MIASPLDIDLQQSPSNRTETLKYKPIWCHSHST